MGQPRLETELSLASTNRPKVPRWASKIGSPPSFGGQSSGVVSLKPTWFEFDRPVNIDT